MCFNKSKEISREDIEATEDLALLVEEEGLEDEHDHGVNNHEEINYDVVIDRFDANTHWLTKLLQHGHHNLEEVGRTVLNLVLKCLGGQDVEEEEWDQLSLDQKEEVFTVLLKIDFTKELEEEDGKSEAVIQAFANITAIVTKSPRKELVTQVSEPRKMWVKVKNTDDLIEINLDKDRPDSFPSNEAKMEWEIATARKALKFKKRVESGEFIPPEIKKKLEEKEKLSAEDRAVLDREKQLEKRKSKLRWLKIEQKLVDLDIAVKTALHLERPAPDRCITALDELNELAVVPLMLKKQPDIVTTIRRLRKYIGPQSYCNWPDKEARDKMERAVQTIQTKADQIYNKFKSFFAYQEGDRTFWEMFEAEVNEFKNKTAGMDESKILSLIRDPTKPLSNLNPLSDDEDL